MTQRGYIHPECRDVRLLLGVYVVGAIEPAERSVVDDHLSYCQACRDELAGLAGLPAMLSRVPVEDVEQLDRVLALPENIEPPAELLDSLLARVVARRRNRLWRGAVAAAAAVAVAAGGATAAVELAQPGSPAQHAEVVSGVDPVTGVGAVVKYVPTPLGTAMKVRVSGMAAGAQCEFYVIGKGGPVEVGQWQVYSSSHWYSVASDKSPSAVTGFKLTTPTGKPLVTIPVS